MDYELADLIDIVQFTELIEKFSAFMGTAMGIFDTAGNVVCGAGWYSACVDYHRVHPKTAEACRKSDLAMLTMVDMSNSIPEISINQVTINNGLDWISKNRERSF